jgi:TPR repeat protein
MPARKRQIAARLSQAEEYYLAACVFDTGMGGKPSPQKAFDLARAARLGGSLNGAALEAILHAEGRGTRRDPKKALRMLRSAAQRGGVLAMTNLGAVLLEGRRGRANHAEGTRWLLRAARKGETAAMLRLATVYLERRDSRNRALSWLRRAANAGSVEGCEFLADLLETGVAGPAGAREATGLRKRAKQLRSELGPLANNIEMLR